MSDEKWQQVIEEYENENPSRKGDEAVDEQRVLGCFDFKGRPTGQTVCRRLKGKFPKGTVSPLVHIWVTNSRGEFLIQQRSPFKQPMAGEWAATGGAVVAGEQSEQGARREFFEELGINPSEGQMRFAARIKRRISFIDIWQVQTDVETCGA